jgi:hypothetical protein
MVVVVMVATLTGDIIDYKVKSIMTGQFDCLIIISSY